MSDCRQRATRNGVTAVESAIMLPVALLILFSLLDLGLATLRYNTLAEAARRIAREAILHGSLAPSAVGAWGPSEYGGTAADDSPIVSSLKGMLPTMPEESVQVNVKWPDGDNGPRDRVQVDVSYTHQSVIPILGAWASIALRSTSTMHIVN